MNTNSKGRIAELIAQAKYINLGYNVLQPVHKDGVYDFVIEKDGDFQKVQAKVVNIKKDIYIIKNQKVSNGKTSYYEEGEFDLLVGVNIDTCEVFQIPFKECTKGEVRLRKTPPKNNQKEKVKFYYDFKI